MPPAVDIFQTLRDKIQKNHGMRPMERRAMYWFKTFTTELNAWQKSLGGFVGFNRLLQQPISKKVVSPDSLLPGRLYFFLYSAKGAEVLPYYDQFPLVVAVDRNADSFTGINFHYLDYFWRAWLFDRLYPLRIKNADDLKVKLPLTYKLLNGTTKYKQFRPCYKRYLYKQMRSPLLQVGESEWDVALWLPVESFVNETAKYVWKESEQKF